MGGAAAGGAPSGGAAIINEKWREAWVLEFESYFCPWCSEPAEATLDLSGGDQQYIEDCPVCCRPILFDLHTDGVDWTLEVRREDD